MSSTEQRPPLRVGVVGAGAGAGQYFDALEQRVADVEAVPLFGVAPDALGAVPLDALIVATATPERAAFVAAAVGRGIPTCCPLPVTGDLSTLDGLILAATEAGVPVFVPNPLRYWSPLHTLHARRRSVGTYSAIWGASRTTRAVAGDIWTDLALPLIDAAWWCAGSEIERVQVMAERLFGATECGDNDHAADAAIMLVRFASGLVATLEVARSLPDTHPQAEELVFELLGWDAILRAVPTNQTVTITNGSGIAQTNWLPTPAAAIAEAFVSAVRDGTPMAQGLLDARWTLPVLEKVRLAAATGEMVRVGGALRR